MPEVPEFNSESEFFVKVLEGTLLEMFGHNVPPREEIPGGIVGLVPESIPAVLLETLVTALEGTLFKMVVSIVPPCEEIPDGILGVISKFILGLSDTLFKETLGVTLMMLFDTPTPCCEVSGRVPEMIPKFD